MSRSTKPQVIPLSSQDVASLNADDIVQIMRRAGFSDQQIMELGTDLRNGLFLSGAAQIKVKDKVEAIFAVHGDYVFITTRLRGSFIYDIERGGFGLRSPSARSASGEAVSQAPVRTQSQPTLQIIRDRQAQSRSLDRVNF